MANEQNITVTETGPDGVEKEFEITTAKAEDLTGEDQTFAEAAVEAMFDDGSADQEASYVDYDGDGTLDTAAADTTGDGQVDTVVADTDGDGEIDAMGLDTDGDGNIDVAAFDTDGDGEIDAIAYDTDGDGQIDAVDIDGDGVVDFTLEASEGLPTEQEISTNSVEFTIGEDMFPNADETAETPENEAYAAGLEAMVDENTVTINDDGTAGVEPVADPFFSTAAEAETTSNADAETASSDAEAAAVAEQQAIADAARDAQAAADEFADAGDYRAAADARAEAETLAGDAGDSSMLGSYDAQDYEYSADKQDQAAEFRDQQAEKLAEGDYEGARQAAFESEWATRDADMTAGGADHTGQAQADQANLDWASHHQEIADDNFRNAEVYAAEGDFDKAEMYADQAANSAAVAGDYGQQADPNNIMYDVDPSSAVETGGTYDAGMAGGHDAGTFDAGTAGGYDAGGFDASVASVDTGIDTTVDTSAASSFDTTSDM